jgi:hypothetical protein
MKYAILYIFALTLAGCNLLDTRDAEPPTQPRSNYEQPFTPQTLISNLVNSLEDKDVQSYINCLVDSSFSQKRFIFSPSSGALAQYPFLVNGWEVKDEEQYVRNLITKVDAQLPVTLSLTNELYNPLGDSLIYTATYNLNVPNTQSEPTNYQGDLRFDMMRDDRSFWVIYYWQDTKSTSLPSWSELKGKFY